MKRFKALKLYRHKYMVDVDMFILSIERKRLTVLWVTRKSGRALKLDHITLKSTDGWTLLEEGLR